jgi:hypothetical protein
LRQHRGLEGPCFLAKRSPTPFTVASRFAGACVARSAPRGAKPVIADDHKGRRAAARRVFNATHQRRRGHPRGTALSRAAAKQRDDVAGAWAFPASTGQGLPARPTARG